MVREIKVMLTPPEHDAIVQKIDFGATIKSQFKLETDENDLEKRMQDNLKDCVIIRTWAFDHLSEAQWDQLKKKVETHLQKFALALRTSMSLSLFGDDYSLDIIKEAMRIIEEDVMFRSLLKLKEMKR